MHETVFAGCVPEVVAGPDGRIIAAGPKAGQQAGRKAEVIRLSGEAWPGLIDSHIHLEGLAERRMSVDLTQARSLEAALDQIRSAGGTLPATSWIVGAGWYNDAWPNPAFPTRRQLDRVAGGRPV